MKYYEEFMRASKFAIFFAAGIFLGTGLVPYILTEDKIEAMQQLLGSLYGVVVSYAGIVLLLFIAEIIRTKRLQKKKEQKK